jgi:hypothetical protein
MPEQNPRPRPRYHGTYKNSDPEGGYSIWIPSDWHRSEMTDGHHGAIYRPKVEDYHTFLSTEKIRLEYGVTMEDIPILREGFQDGLNRMEGLEIESQDESITETLKMFQAVFTFTEDGVQRKRWLRVVFWDDGELIMMAQGSTPPEYAYWKAMFYNALMTIEIPVG